jgi:Zn-dependent metalloprotease
MSKRNIPHYVCGVIPPHMLTRLAGTPGPSTEEASANARATLEHMRELATGQSVASLIRRPAADATAVPSRRKRRHVYDAQHQFRLPGRLVMSRQHKLRGTDVEATEAYDGSGATYEFFSKVFGRKSIDGKGMRLDSTVHYGTRFENALWNGRQMVYGDGDGRIFKRFTASLDVIAHELTHGYTQHAAALGYNGQTGALNEHLADAFASMVKQWMLGQTAHEADWRIGADILGPDFQGHAIRSMASPGTAYDDPVLGRDPQPSHMRDYVVTTEDNGGVHINSGILNHGFYLAAMAVGGKTWEVVGKVWYLVFTERLQPEADFADFTRATVDVAGELFGFGGRVQRIVAEAWSAVGLEVSEAVPLSECATARIPVQRPQPAAAPKRRRRPARSASTTNEPQTILERRTIS